jgi:hypothetical protein
MAKTLNMPHITIFESDCYPMKDCRAKLGEFLDNGGVPDDADEVVLGSINFIRRYDKFLKDVDGRFGRIKKNLWGAHAVVIFNKAYDKWLNGMLGCTWEIHADFFNNLVPNCYATTRSFFVQWKDKFEYPNLMVDKENLSYFPSNA